AQARACGCAARCASRQVCATLARPDTTFFCSAAASPAIYTLSLHDALPILPRPRQRSPYWSIMSGEPQLTGICLAATRSSVSRRSEEHTSELQSRENLVCRLLLEKKKATARPETTRMSRFVALPTRRNPRST